MRTIGIVGLIAAALLGGSALSTTVHATGVSGASAASSSGGTGLLCMLVNGTLSDDVNGSGDGAVTGNATCGGHVSAGSAGASGGTGSVVAGSGAGGGGNVGATVGSGGSHTTARSETSAGRGGVGGGARSGRSSHHHGRISQHHRSAAATGWR
jgi:hypothetical protein